MLRNKDLFPVQHNKKLSLNRHSNSFWVEESFCSQNNDFVSNAEIGENNFLGISLNRTKINATLFFLLTGLILLLSRCFYLQVIKGDHYLAISRNNRVREQLIEPNRGVLYDRYGQQLVDNVPTFSLFLIPADLPREEEKRLAIYEELYVVLEKYRDDLTPLKEFKDNIENQLGNLLYYSYSPLLVQENLNYDEALLLQIESKQLAGIDVQTEAQRSYRLTYTNEEGAEQKTESLSHLFGYLGRISQEEYSAQPKGTYRSSGYIGKNGLEQEYEKILRGLVGKTTVEVDAIGKPKKVISKEKAIDGKNLVLSLDLELQRTTEKIIKSYLEEKDLHKAVAVILNPNNGEILSLVSLPGYDINLFARGIRQKEYASLLEDENKPLYNRSISGEYPSGSTFKPVVAAAALEENVINYNTLINSNGGIRIDRWFFPDWKNGGHGLTSVTKAISESVNTFFYLIGGGDQEDFDGLGVRKIKAYAENFGLSLPLGIDLPGERPGFLPDPEWKERVKQERWYIGDTYHFAIGQGDILVTPLQVAGFTSVFANKGKLYQPHLLQSITDEDGIKKNFEPSVIQENTISPENLNTIRYGMRKTVLTGSARSLAEIPMNIAGKTGTAQWGTDKVPHSWFTSFAPYEKPELVITVLVEEGGEGSEIAVPISKEIYRWYYDNRVEK